MLNHNWAIPHHPLEARGRRSLRAPIAPQGGISLLTRWIGDNVRVEGALTAEQRLQRMAGSIGALTELSEGELRGFASTELARWQGSQVALFQQQLNRSEELGSRNWQQYLERCREEAFAALQTVPSWSDLLAYPVDEPAATLNLVRQGGKRLAAGLEAWPALWRAAQSFET